MRWVSSITLCLVGFIAAPGSALGATTIGQTSNTGTMCGGGAGSGFVQALSAANAYRVPAGGGVITSWSHNAQAGAGQSAKLKVYRPNPGPNDFIVVGHSTSEPLPPGNVSSHLTRISVQSGDTLGITQTSSASIRCIFSTAAAGDVEGDLGAADEADGAPATTAGTSSNFRVNVSAVVEADGDSDGYGDESQDNCVGTANPTQADADTDGIGDACDDGDTDGVLDVTDNCVGLANADQADLDSDGAGDACDTDDDGDGATDATDNCPRMSNPSQDDVDGDALGDACDPTDNRPPPPPSVVPDVTAPETTITKAPTGPVGTADKKAKVKVRFESNEAGSTFECHIDAKAFAPCSSPRKLKLAPGKHRFYVRATDAVGNADGTPASVKIKVVSSD